MNLINERVKAIYSHSGLKSQKQFAERIGVSASLVGEILADKKGVGLAVVEGISSSFPEINSQWLISGRGEMLNQVQTRVSTTIGVPYYDIDVSASFLESFNDIKEDPEFYVDFRPFNDCTAYLSVYGDSMYPMFASGEIVALKKVENPRYILYGEPHLIITNAEANNMRTLKLIRKSTDKSMIVLKPANPNFDELEIPRDTILSLYLVKGKITRKQL